MMNSLFVVMTLITNSLYNRKRREERKMRKQREKQKEKRGNCWEIARAQVGPLRSEEPEEFNFYLTGYGLALNWSLPRAQQMMDLR